LATSEAPDDAPAVLFDVPDLRELPAPGPADRLAAVLRTLTSVDSVHSLDSSAGGSADDALPAAPDVVIATVAPVVDTLKLVDADGFLTGTAERDEHRFVGTPIAARLRVLRAVCRELDDIEPGQFGPTPIAVLAALVGRGATVLGSH